MTGSSVIDGTGPILLDNLLCTGSELRLIDCPHNGLGNHNCRHSDDAGVRCLTLFSKAYSSISIRSHRYIDSLQMHHNDIYFCN